MTNEASMSSRHLISTVVLVSKNRNVTHLRMRSNDCTTSIWYGASLGGVTHCKHNTRIGSVCSSRHAKQVPNALWYAASVPSMTKLKPKKRLRGELANPFNTKHWRFPKLDSTKGHLIILSKVSPSVQFCVSKHIAMGISWYITLFLLDDHSLGNLSYSFCWEYLLHGFYSFQMVFKIGMEQVRVKCFPKARSRLFLQLLDKFISGAGEVPLQNLTTQTQEIRHHRAYNDFMASSPTSGADNPKVGGSNHLKRSLIFYQVSPEKLANKLILSISWISNTLTSWNSWHLM